MNLQQTLFIVGIGILQLICVFELIRRHMLRERYALLWICITVVFFTSPFLFDVYVAAGRFVGIMAPTSIFLLLAILGFMLLNIQASLATSLAYAHLKTLTQQLALLENRVRVLEQRGTVSNNKTEL